MGFTFSLFTNFLVWIQYKIYTHRNFNNQFLLLDLLFKLHPPSRLPHVLIPTKKKKRKTYCNYNVGCFNYQTPS